MSAAGPGADCPCGRWCQCPPNRSASTLNPCPRCPHQGRGWGDGLPPQHAACQGHGNTSTLSFFFFRRVCQSLLPGQSPLQCPGGHKSSSAPRNTQPPGWRSSLNPSLSQAPRRPSHPMMVHALPDTDLDAPSVGPGSRLAPGGGDPTAGVGRLPGAALLAGQEG